MHHEIPLDTHCHLALVSLVQAFFNAAEAGSSAAGPGIQGGRVVIIPLATGKAAGKTALKELIEIFLVSYRVYTNGLAVFLIEAPADVIVTAEVIDKPAVGRQTVEIIQLPFELPDVGAGQGTPLCGHGGGVVEEMALRLFRGTEIGGQLLGSHHHFPFQDHSRTYRLRDEADHPHDGMDLGEVAAGGAHFLPQVGHRIDAEDLHPQIGQVEHTADHIVEYRRIAVVEIPLVGMEGGTDVFLHILLIDKAARRGLREHIGNGLFHLPGNIRRIKADIAVDVFLFARLCPHGPGVSVRRMIDDKVETQAHAATAHGSSKAAEILVGTQGRVHLIEILHSISAVVIGMGHLQQRHQVQIGDPLLCQIIQPLFQTGQIA